MAHSISTTRRLFFLAALAASWHISGCTGTGPEVFDATPRSAAATAAPWPHLADVPPTPPQGVYTESIPDPATGESIQIELAIAADEAARRRDEISGPVR